MADEAYLVLDDGSKIKVEAKKLGQADRGKNLLCCGKVGGRECIAKMSLVIKSKGRNSFAALSHPGHIRLCPYDKSGDSVRISYMDPTGAKETLGGLFEKFNWGKKKATGKRRPPTKRGTEIDQEDEDEKGARRVRRVPGSPKNLTDLIFMLLSLNCEDIYSNTPVGDFLIDHRSIRRHRRDGLKEGQIAISVCNRTKQGWEYRDGPNSIVLTDGFFYEQDDRDNKLYFVIRTTEEGARMILDAPKEDKIAVLSRWYKHPEYDRVYLSEKVNPGCIAIIEKNYFQ